MFDVAVHMPAVSYIGMSQEINRQSWQINKSRGAIIWQINNQPASHCRSTVHSWKWAESLKVRDGTKYDLQQGTSCHNHHLLQGLRIYLV
jgi:hypothetical protein